VTTYESEFTRPSLPIPLFPLRWAPLFIRSHLVGLRGQSFATAYRRTLAAAAAGIVVAAAAFLTPPPWQDVVVGCSALIGIYVTVRVLALAVFERRQHTFAREWIAAQSNVLREHQFEVLRFTVEGLTGEGQGVRRTYDLTRPVDVRDLLRRQDRERTTGRLSRVSTEFTYLTGDGALAVAEVHRALPEFTFLVGWAGPGRAWVRFPEARYVGRPRRDRHPAQRTQWALSGSVLLRVADSAHSESGGPAPPPSAPTESSGPGPAR